MKKFGEFICKKRKLVVIVSCILLVLSFIGMKLTKINYDILVYLPEDIETIKGQNTLTNDFNMGAYAISIIENMSSKDVLTLESDLKNIEGVNEVVSLYDVIGTSIPVEMLPSEVTSKLHKGNTDLLLITFSGSTSSEDTIDAVREIREKTDEHVSVGGMSSMVLDTMELSEKEIFIYVAIAVLLCIIVLEFSLDSYIVPILLLANIGFAIVFNLGTNIFLGEISYITKALVAVLQLGVTTDFSIFLYHSYEKKKHEFLSRMDAMVEAIKETFTSVTGSSLTTIAGFLVLCTMSLTLGMDLGIVMAKGVLLGVITVLTLFPSLLLLFDKLIEKTKHKMIVPNFTKLNKFVVKHHIAIFILFLVLVFPAYKAYSKVPVYYKIDKTLPDTLESIKTNDKLKNDYNIVSPEIILLNRNLKTDSVTSLAEELENVEGIDFVLTFAKIKSLGLTEDYLDSKTLSILENDEYQIMLINSTYDVASDELNNQISIVNDIVKKYDSKAIVAGEGPLMKDLIEISDQDFKNVNTSSIICIFIILFIVLRSLSLPFLLISAIEFAIFVNMGISYFSGATLPFVAPIVLGTIQLGATIDYAILLTTTYLSKRRSGMDKKEAMVETLNYCGNSIFVSGMCFFAATFGVGIYSDLEMVGSLCSLISRGAIISMLVVITVLPSILLIFDKLIMLSTLKNKEEKKNMKKNIKKVTASILLMALLINAFPINALAITKNETVYTKLNSDGTVIKTIVNENLINDKGEDTIKDYSNLENILNINDDSKYSIDNKNITWESNGKDIFYQGTTDKKLPINVNVSYKLDGDDISLDDLMGKSGKVAITIKYENLAKHNLFVNGKEEVLYTPFVITLGTIIDAKTNSNVSITNGKVISSGTNNIVVGIAAPGMYESLGLSELKGMDKITISFDTTKFELASIYSVATPKLLDSSDLNVFEKLDSLYENIDKLEDSMDKIDEGAKQVKDGSNLLKNTLSSSIDSLKKDNSNALTNEQVEAIKNQAVSSVNAKLTDNYKKGVANATWNEVKRNLNPNDPKAVEIVTNSVKEAVQEYLINANLLNDYVACETGKAVANQGGAMTQEQMASCGVILADTTLPLVQKSATTAASKTAQDISLYVSENISKQVAVKILEEVAPATAGEVAETLAPMVANEVKNASLATITKSLTALYDGVSTLDDGINSLSTGISTFNQDGIKTISNLVNTKVKKTSSKVRALTKLSEAYETFGGNTQNAKTTTKFVLVIDAKKLPKETVKTESNDTKTSFWDRLTNLFN